MQNKSLKIILGLLFLLIIAGAAYWQFFLRGNGGDTSTDGTSTIGGFVPLGRNPTGSTPPTRNTPSTPTTPTTGSNGQKPPALRLLSNTPVGGYGASTTGSLKTPAASSTTAIRWVDRGRGNTYEARGNTMDIVTLSNTVVPRIYESIWNKNLTAFIALTLPDDTDNPTSVYAELRPFAVPKTGTSSPATLSSSSQTPYELKGKSLPENIITYAVSPKKDKVFLLVNEKGTGVGYISAFNGSAATQLFTTPLTQLNAEWPTDSIIALTTRGSASERGYLYFVDTKTGVWKKIVGPLPGLSTKVSTDAKRVLISATGKSGTIATSIYTVADKKGIDAVVRTLADKCVWGNFYKEIVYCGVPSQPVTATYPDDWYRGTVSMTDKIWQVNAVNGEVKLVSSIVDSAGRLIDAINLGLDEKDDFLIFMNKKDLSLWSLDLVAQ